MLNYETFICNIEIGDINVLSLFFFFVSLLSLASYNRLLVEKIMHIETVFYEQLMSQ